MNETWRIALACGLVLSLYGDFSSAQFPTSKRDRLISEFRDAHPELTPGIRDTLAAHAVDALLTYANAIRDTLTTSRLSTTKTYVKRVADSVGIRRDVIVIASTGRHMSPVHAAIVSSTANHSEIILDTVLWSGQGSAWIRLEDLGFERPGFCTPVIGQHCGMTSACFGFLWTDGVTAKLLEVVGCQGFELRDLNGDGIRDVEVQYGGNLAAFLVDTASIRLVEHVDTTFTK